MGLTPASGLPSLARGLPVDCLVLHNSDSCVSTSKPGTRASGQLPCQKMYTIVKWQLVSQ